MIDRIMETIKEKPIDIARLQTLLGEANSVDIAGIFEDIGAEHLLPVFRLLPKDIAAEVFSYIEPETQLVIIEALTDSEAGRIINELYVDDAVDLMDEMPANVVNRILQNIGAEKRALINQLLQYPDDSAGSLMTTEYVDLRENYTVADAFAHIRNYGVNKETIYTCYVISRDRLLVGVVSVKTLLLANPADTISKIMDKNIVYAYTSDDQEAVASLFKKYDLLALPVVDKERRLVGIVTVDDVIQIIEEEATEDIQIMGALNPSDEPYLKASVFKQARDRIMWLLVLMLSATVTGAVISGFEDSLALLPSLVIFIPMLMDTGGNAGSQSSTLIIRGMALGEIKTTNILEVLWRELRISLLCGTALGLVNFVRVYLMNGHDVLLSLTITLSLVVTLIIAKSVGCVLPLVAKMFKMDPAIMAAPLITTIVDGASLVVYFSIAKAILHI